MNLEQIQEANAKLDAIPLQLTEEQKQHVWLYDIINNALKKAYYKLRAE